MGIKGLLPFLQNASREIDIRNFSGSTVAIDTYCWLHKGAFSCAEKLGRGEPTDGYVHYCMKMVNVIVAAGLKPILVFDGQNLPSKSLEEKKRRENREKYRKLAKQYLREGKIKEARECFQKTVDITPEMAHEVIVACRKKNIDCIVAPYEADAQLAYLVKCGVAQLVITEDSDLILFGCERVIFKLDMVGRGIMVEKSEISKCLRGRAENFTFEKFRYTCILSGCDYLPSLPGIGLAKACKFFNLITNPDVYKALSKLPGYLKMPNLMVTVEYKEGFVRANNTFLYQLVFCPLQKKVVPLNPYPPDINPKDMTYAGTYLPQDLAEQLARGNMHLHTMRPFDDRHAEREVCTNGMWDSREHKENHNSIWNSNYKTPKVTLSEKMSDDHHNHQTKGHSVVIRTENIIREISGPQKRDREHPPMTEEEIEENLSESFCLPAGKKTNIEKSPLKNSSYSNISSFMDSKFSPQIIRSRFFASSSPSTRESPVRTTSWLDAIDTEYGLGSPSQTRSIDTSRKSPFATLDRKISQANQPTTTRNKNRSLVEESQKDEMGTVKMCVHSEEDSTIVEPKKIESHKFRWSKSPFDSGFGTRNLTFQNSPKSSLKFKSVLPKSPVSDSDREEKVQGSPSCSQTLLSQYTVCSIDEESFSQKSSASSQECELDLTNSEENPLIASTESDEVFQKLEKVPLVDFQVLYAFDENNKTKVLKKNKATANTKKGLGSRCSGLRKRVIQPSIKDMVNKFSFERAPRVISN